MTETQRRIREYQKALPHMKERVVAIMLLLVMSVTMLASASFAWITLSRAPEVSGLATTVSTNGNLEIALSDTDGLEPDATAVGDGGQAVTLSNLTWGNLINLSDPSYGLDEITLRPAVLNSGSLEDSPLYAVTYGADGRIDDIALDFAFTNYQQSQIEGAGGAFVAPNNGIQYGVRAISSVQADTTGANADLLALSNSMAKNLLATNNSFKALYGNNEYIDAITKLAGIYITYRINDTDQNCSSHIKPLYEMMREFGLVLDQMGQTVLSAANLQHYLYCDKLNGDEDPANNLTYVPFTLTQLHSGTTTDNNSATNRQITLSGNAVYDQLLREGFQNADNDMTITALKMYVNARQKYLPTFAAIKALYDQYTTAGTRVGWEALRDHINVMADIYTTTIDGIETRGISSSNIGKLTGGGTKECVVHFGLLVDMDQLLGTHMYVEGVKATVMGFVNVEANVTTAAQNHPPYQLAEAVNLAKDKASGGASSTTLTATDTYGMVVDFWVRTNAADSLLTLEGELVTRTVEVTDSEGNVVLDDDGKPVTQTVVVGYKGANRVWEENDPGLPVLGTSTTQGSGSCYVFYPETPEDQTQSLELLQAMCVAFIGTVVDENGKEETVLLAQADMDTANAFEDGGRVLVPLKLRAKSVQTDQPELDENGDIVYNQDGSIKYQMANSYHIMEMEQNKAQRITAIVYMDGSRLTNSEVLAAGDIRGQLNIQFGTSEDITSMDDKDLKDQFYNITISADPTEFGFYDPENKPVVNLSLAVNGMTPRTIQGNFVSYISSTQGARQPTFRFVKQDGGGWTAAVELNGAGTYQLRSIQIDGVDYALSAEQIEALTIKVQGTTVTSVSCENWNGNSFSHMSADPYYSVKMLAEVSGVAPRAVQGVFVHDDGQNVTVSFTRTNNGWEGTGMFTTSGTYRMTYMIIDDVYVPLPETQHKTLTLQLGLNAQVFVEAPVNAAYKELEEDLAAAVTAGDEAEIRRIEGEMEALLEQLYSDAENCLDLQQTREGYSLMYSGSEPLFLKVACIISDDKDHVMSGLGDVDLYYGIGVSQLNRLQANNMTWNAGASRYEGEFVMTRPGYYNFQLVDVNGNQITRATSAPSIRAVSPEPIEYLGKSGDYAAYVEEIRRDATRSMDVVLGKAPSAVVGLELTHTDEGVAPTKYLFTNDGSWPEDIAENSGYAGVYTLLTIDNGDDTYTYRANVPTDGTWKVTGMMVSGVFYKEPGQSEGVFYDGSMEEGGTGWLNFTDKVLADDITTEFFTTVNFSANKQPEAEYNSIFMEDHPVNGMTISLTDYLGRAIPDTKVTLSYTWNEATNDAFQVPSGTNLPNRAFGGALTSADGKTFAMPDMNFQLDGQYNVKFVVELNGTKYEEISRFTVPEDGGFGAWDVFVDWTLPTVKITAVTPDVNTPFAAQLSASSSTPNDTVQVKNYFTDKFAAVYSSISYNGIGYGDWTRPKVTLQLQNVDLSAESGMTASTVLGNIHGAQYANTFTFEQVTDESGSTKVQATADVGHVMDRTGWTDGVPTLRYAGEQTISTVDVVYGGVTYTLNLAGGGIVINNPICPPYMDFSVTDTDYLRYGGTVPVRLVSQDGKTITLPDKLTLSYDRYETETGAQFVKSNPLVTSQSGNDYYYYYDDGNWRTNDWRGYYRLGTRWDKTAQTDTYTVTKTISQWTVGDATYNSGQQISASGHMTATANVSSSEKLTSSGTVTTYKWVYEYIATGEAAGRENNGLFSTGITGMGYSIKLDSLDSHETNESTSPAEP
ncbi:MAG: hypothetical protein E7457_02850 [Ruminococcaceae bacterium]|nr:hypothetical protein [Oscillospiraceae bacterium]